MVVGGRNPYYGLYEFRSSRRNAFSVFVLVQVSESWKQTDLHGDRPGETVSTVRKDSQTGIPDPTKGGPRHFIVRTRRSLFCRVVRKTG